MTYAMGASGGYVASQTNEGGESATDEEPPGQPARCRFCRCTLCSADTHEGLCDNLEFHSLLDPGSPLALAFRQVDRGDYVPSAEEREGVAYVDAAVYLGFGAQISAPHVHAHALRLLFASSSEPSKTAPLRILDIGSGSGFACAVLARLLQFLRPDCSESRVLAVEHIPELAERARASLEKHHGDLLASGRLELQCADGRRLAEENPGLLRRFSFVHCGCAVDAGDEAWLVEVLAEGGRAVFPRGLADEPQRLCILEVGPGGSWQVHETEVAVLYVPATSQAEQRARGDEWDQVVQRCKQSAQAAFG
uniref:protein-L-isoaspartate(D-aspartate) O-methyltransferase n=1 Tax=Alexandrium monilatum TaxID=311494 RepID=A0A7S4UGS1_9DINO